MAHASCGCFGETDNLSGVINAGGRTCGPAERSEVCHGSLAVEEGVRGTGSRNCRVPHDLARVVDAMPDTCRAAERSEIGQLECLLRGGPTHRSYCAYE